MGKMYFSCISDWKDMQEFNKRRKLPEKIMQGLSFSNGKIKYEY